MNIQRLPTSAISCSASTAGNEVAVLSTLIHQLQGQMSDLTTKVDEIKVCASPSSVCNTEACSSARLVKSNTVSTDLSVPVIPASTSQHPAKCSRADLAADLASMEDTFKSTSYPQLKSWPPAAILPGAVMRGKRLVASSVKAVPRQLVCFVGRLDPSTTEDELCNFLAEVGILIAKCKKL